jgi:SAM-dependent methyltransferase
MENNNQIKEFYPYTWVKPKYQQSAQDCFNEIDSYLSFHPPKRILDIGCGYAYVSEQFQKKYGTELWLLEGDFQTTIDRPRKATWGEVEDFKFYLPVADLKEYWNSRGIKYNFVDANNINIPEGMTFDLVSSWLSCGFHYPAKTYKSLVEKHTTSDSKVIFDFRTKTLLNQQSQDIKVIHNFNPSGGKRSRVHFNFS